MSTPPPLRLTWEKGRGNSWCELFAVDVDNAHFKGFTGVFVLWHAGKTPEVLAVGQGFIAENIRALREKASVLAYRSQGLFITWASTEPAVRDGVCRFLAEALRPKAQEGLSWAAQPIEVNLPGRERPGQGAAPQSAHSVQKWEEMVPQEGEGPAKLKAHEVEVASQPADYAPDRDTTVRPVIKRLSRLQKQFDEYVEKLRQKPRGGLFSRDVATRGEEEVINDISQMLLREAMTSNASDIHLEPMGDRLRVRFRVDGLLEPVLEIPNNLKLYLVSHIRVICGLDPEKGVAAAKPQDGRMAVVIDGREADLRLATFPTSQGDKAVLRILPRKQKPPALGELGLRPPQAAIVRQLIDRPQGMIIVTGPTGSGKSTTLYTIIHELNLPSRNIVTLEDPIEMKIDGVTQGAIQSKIGFSFADGLRAILRQDPNVIMVGEIRDTETAEIALRASLTGHLLLTTLHTNSALGAVTRLLDMGIEAFLISSAASAVMAQRLTRRICPHCRETYQPDAAELARIAAVAERIGAKFQPEHFRALQRGRGCDKCRQSGFLGRVPIFEVVRISPMLRNLILHKASVEEMQRCTRQEGTETMLLDGLHKIQAGLITIDELVRVGGSGD
jgi:type II secretory ATPase GspE/PulE/Tfp pilus assembly ATPase PilB-like protein